MQVINSFKNSNIRIRKIGDRPATGKVDSGDITKLPNRCSEIIEKYTSKKAKIISASTDCNVPLSMGIPAVCIGTYDGSGEHTTEAYVEKTSLKKGFMIATEVILKYSA